VIVAVAAEASLGWSVLGFSLEALDEVVYEPFALPQTLLLYEDPVAGQEQHIRADIVREDVADAQPEPAVVAAAADLELTSTQIEGLEGLPVFRVGGEEVVFVAHVLQRVLPCTCRLNRHHGLFKCKKFGRFRRQIDTSERRHDIQAADAYDLYRNSYPMTRLRRNAGAITVEGLSQWKATKMDVFVSREVAKCKRGCVKGKCTCPAKK